MGDSYEGKGTVLKDGLIRLDAPANLPRGRVHVVVEPESDTKCGSIFDIPPAPGGGRPAEELLAELRALRDEWDRDWDRDNREGRE